MNKVLKRAIDKISALPDETQEYAASLLEQIAASAGGAYRLSDEERELVGAQYAAAIAPLRCQAAPPTKKPGTCVRVRA